MTPLSLRSPPPWGLVLLALAGILSLGLLMLGPVDRCLDAGGCRDSVHDRCELEDDAHCGSSHAP